MFCLHLPYHGLVWSPAHGRAEAMTAHGRELGGQGSRVLGWELNGWKGAWARLG